MKINQNLEDWLWSVACALALLAMMFFYTPSTKAQNVVLKGNVFTSQSAKKDSVDTGYRYKDQNGNFYPVYLSASGKAYCWMKSKRTGKMYKRYLPKITQMLKDMDNGKYSK